MLGQSFEHIAELTARSGDDWIIYESTQTTQQHVVFVDSRVEGYESLLDSLLPVADSETGSVPVIEIVILDADRDGVEQITDYLSQHTNISAIHILAHGDSASTALGSTTLDQQSLDSYADQLSSWGTALTVDADIMLYGCEIAGDEWGVEFVENIAALTGADVAASTDKTGAEVLGGDWDLELQVGSIEQIGVDGLLDVGLLPSLLESLQIEVLSTSATFSSLFPKGVLAGSNIDLRSLSGDFEWKISANGEITISKKFSSDKVKFKVTGDSATLKLYASTSGSNTFTIANNAAFGSSGKPAMIIGNGTATELRFTPVGDSADSLLPVLQRVSTNVDNIDLDDGSVKPIKFGKVYFFASEITKFEGGKGDDEVFADDNIASELIGGRGDDDLNGGSLSDTLYGGRGSDTLVGQLGGDVLEGGSGSDQLYGAYQFISPGSPESGTDDLRGGTGDDTYHFSENWGLDEIRENSGEGNDTLEFSRVGSALTVEVGVSSVDFATGVVVTDSTDVNNKAKAKNIDVIELGTGANVIEINPAYAADSGNKLVISNALNTTVASQDNATASLDLSKLSSGVQITISKNSETVQISDTETVVNPNGNKVVVKFDSGATLTVFNVKDITATNFSDKVIIQDGAVLHGTLDLGKGSNEVIVNGDISKVTGDIFGDDSFDLLRVRPSLDGLLALNAEDQATINGLTDIIRTAKGLKDGQVLDLATQYGVRLSANNIVGDVNLETFLFEGVIVEGGGSTGSIISIGNSRLGDSATIVGKKDLVQGGSKDDILIGGPNEGDIKGGKGNDILVSGTGSETLSGQAGADVYVFKGEWGRDTVKSLSITETARDTLNFSLSDKDLRYYFRDGQIYVGQGSFDTTDLKFSSTNTVTAEKGTFGGIINKIVLSSTPGTTQEFVFGNDWGRTTIEVPEGTSPNLTLDFSNTYEELRFEFKADGSLIVTKLGGLQDIAKDTLPDKVVNAKSIIITKIDENTRIITGSNSNIYRVEEFEVKGTHTGADSATTLTDANATFISDKVRVGMIVKMTNTSGLSQTPVFTGEWKVTEVVSETELTLEFVPDLDNGDFGPDFTSTSKYKIESVFEGQLDLTGGVQKIRVPFSEGYVPNVLLENVQHTIDLGGSLKTEVADVFIPLKNAFTSGSLKTAATSLLSFIGDQTNGANLALNETARGILSSAPVIGKIVSADLIEGVRNVNFINGADVDNVVLGGFGLNVALGDLLLPGDFGDNTFTTKQFAPGVHILSGLTGADEYEFNNFWGLALVLEIPDLDLGVPIPDATDKLDFSGVFGGPTDLGIDLGGEQEIIVDVYSNPGEATGVDFVDLLNELGIGTDVLTFSDTSNFVVARAVIAGETVSTVIALDIESLVGPSFGTMTIRFHGDATLVGTVAPGLKGDVVLDYSNYATGVETALDTSQLPTGDFGFTNLASGLFFELSGVPDPFPEQTTGGATGIEGNRFGGLTTLFDVLSDLSGSEQRGLLADFGVDTVTKVIGNPNAADTHQLAGEAKEYVIGAGDRIIKPEGLNDTVADLLGPFERDASEIGETTLRFDVSAADGVILDLSKSTLNLEINGVKSDVLSPEASTDTPDGFNYKIVSGTGDDKFTGSNVADTFVFEVIDHKDPADPNMRIDCGHDTIDLSGDQAKEIRDVLDFTSIDSADGQVYARWEGTTLVFELKKGKTGSVLSSVRVTGVYGSAAPTDLEYPDIAEGPGNPPAAFELFTVTAPSTVPLLTASPAPTSGDPLPADVILTSQDLSPLVDEAVTRWAEQNILVAGTPVADVALLLSDLTVIIADLPGEQLAGLNEDGAIVIDVDAAGYGWYFDLDTPDSDLEFETTTGGLTAIDGGQADGRIDLLSAIMHEIGHKLGVPHDGTPGVLMADDIGPGERRGIPGGEIRILDLTADQQLELNAGLDAFAAWADDLGANLDDYLAGTNIPFTEKSLPELLGITSSAEALIQAATNDLKAAIAAVLESGDASAAGILAIDGSLGTEFTYTIENAPNANPNSFIATFDLLPGDAPVASLDLSGLQLDGVDLGFSVDDLEFAVNADLQLVVEFGLDRDSEFYVRSPELVADLEVTSGAGGVNASLSLGPLGLSVVNGSIDVIASARLVAEGFITAEELAANTIDAAALEPVTNAGYNIDLPITLAGGLSGATTDDVAIRATGILPTGAGDLLSFIQGMDIQFQNFDQLFQLRGISIEELLNGIVTVIDGIIDSGILDEEIPGIGQSMATILSEQLDIDGENFLVYIKEEILKIQEEEGLTGVEDALNGLFNSVFKAEINPVKISLVDSVLVLDLSFEQALARFDKSFDLDLASFVDELDLGSLVPDEILDTVAEKLSIESSGIDLFADLTLGFDIGIGLDLTNVLDPEQIITDDTGIFVRLEAGLAPVDFAVALDVSDIDFSALLSGFDGLIDPADIPSIDTVGFGIDQGTADLDFTLEFGLPDT